uniref:Ubiquitin-like domain-containing protein n=1 Tax=Romanomermis culicivorax TaxID=13658 RepID=A0A915L3W7_ROMCU
MADTDYVKLKVTNSSNALFSERRFAKNVSIGELKLLAEEILKIRSHSKVLWSLFLKISNKIDIDSFPQEKLELITGILSTDMQLEIRPPETNEIVVTKIQRLTNDSVPLNSYDICDDCILHVIDSVDNIAQSSDQVQKYLMSDEAYERRTDTVRHFKKQLQLGRFDPSRGESPNVMSQKEYGFKIGDRCQVELEGQMPKRGTIMYFGKIFLCSLEVKKLNMQP